MAPGGGLPSSCFQKILLASLAIVILGSAASAADYFVYFGTYTGESSQGIYVSELNTSTGDLTVPELAAATPSPCFLAVSPDGKCLYSADSVTSFRGEPVGSVSAFAIDKHSGHLALLNQKSSGGSGPCHVSTDAAGTLLLVANYGAGSVKAFRLNHDGSIGADGNCLQLHGTSVNTNRQAGPHAHFICMDPSNRFALACDLGADAVVACQVDFASGALSVFSTAKVPPGAGARHLAFSQDGKFACVINEMGCSVTTFAWDPAGGRLTPIGTVSVLPPEVPVRPAYTGAEILASGHCLYATVRGYDGISVLRRDASSGRLTLLQNIFAGGKMPRGLGIDPTGRWLITGNQKTGAAVEFEIDPASGKLSATGRELKVGSPVDVKFVAKQ